jgi:diadenylate cyclase
MPLLPANIVPDLSRFSITSAIDIILVAVLIYQFLMMVRGRRAAPILTGVGMLAVVYVIALYARFELLRTLLAALAPYTAFGMIVMFQSEIRRVLARIGRSPIFAVGGSLQRREVKQEVVLAVQQMASRQIGALIVLERDVGLRTFVESGITLDAAVSRDLLCSIFEPGGALHDGAVIIQRDRVAAAACFLPLTMNPALQSELGTRHRAAIGITEEADCLSIIVSEETGRVSVVAFGEIEMNVGVDRLEERINSHERRREPRRAPEHASERVSGLSENPAREMKGL